MKAVLFFIALVCLVFAKDVDQCTHCKNVVQEIQTQSKYSTETLEKLCNLDEGCISTLQPHFGSILSSVRVGEGSSVCPLLGLCNGPLQNPENPKILQKSQFNFTCALCQTIISNVFTNISPNETVENLILLINKSCEALPLGHEVCAYLEITSRAREIIDAYINHMSVISTCQYLDLCSANKHKNNSSSSKPIDISCSLCQAVMSWAKSQLNGDSSESKVSDFVNHMCDNVPTLLSSECTVIKQYGTIVKNGLEQNLSNEQICKQCHLCKSTRKHISEFHARIPKKNPRIKHDVQENSDEPECQTCQWAVSAVESYIAQDTTEEELGKVLQELCTVLPGNYSKVCENFVSVYLSEVLVYVLDNLTPPVVCQKLKVCI